MTSYTTCGAPRGGLSGAGTMTPQQFFDNLDSRATVNMHTIVDYVCRQPSTPTRPHPPTATCRKLWNAACRDAERLLFQNQFVTVGKLGDFYFKPVDCDGVPGKKIRAPFFQVSEQFVRMYNVDKQVFQRDNALVTKQMPLSGAATENNINKDDAKYFLEDVVSYIGEQATDGKHVIALNFGFCIVYITKTRTTTVQYMPHFLSKCFDIDSVKWPPEIQNLVRSKMSVPRPDSDAAAGVPPFPCAQTPPRECVVCDYVKPQGIPPRTLGSALGAAAGHATPSAPSIVNAVPFRPTNQVGKTFTEMSTNNNRNNNRPAPPKSISGMSTASVYSVFDVVDDSESVYNMIRPAPNPKRQQAISKSQQQPPLRVGGDALPPPPQPYQNKNNNHNNHNNMNDFLSELQRAEAEALAKQREQERVLMEYNNGNNNNNNNNINNKSQQ
eukprot:PhM_4_TR8378/c2_g1_i1/m.65972